MVALDLRYHGLMHGIDTERPSVADRPRTDSGLKTGHLSSWIELSRSAHHSNLAFLRRCVGDDVELSAVVKSNAYGHGLELMASSAVEAGADSFCVHALDEALILRRAGFSQDILVMGHVPLARLGEAVEQDLRLVLYNPETLDRLAEETSSQGRSVRVHLKVETGTHRQGVEGAALDGLLVQLKGLPRVQLEGVYTHFANIEDTTDHQYARRQMARFRAALETVERAGFAPTKRHAACSAATVLFPETHFDLVRVGISQYGFWSSKETLLSHEHSASEGSARRTTGSLTPVLSWKTRVSQVKSVEAGAAVGYGCTFVTTRPSRIAILPIGYSDGYDRGLSSSAHVLIRGRRAQVCGRVCMNLTMVDVTDIPGVQLEDEVVLIGRQGDAEISADHLAGLTGTIHYEVVTRLGPHLPRLMVD